MTDVLQCPYCDLRFTTRSELDQHKAFDHPDKEEEAAMAEPAPDPVAPRPEPEQSPPPAEQKKGLLSRLFKGG